MARASRRPHQVVAGIVIAVLALLSGCAAFRSVTKDGSSAGTRPGSPAGITKAAAGSSTGRGTGGGTGKGRSTPARTQVRTVTAAGSQLWAPGPLSDIHQDQGSSILLPDGRTLWIFADTFQLYNDPKFFTTSAAGVTNPGSWKLQYSMGSAADRSSGLRYPAEFMPRTLFERTDRKAGDYYQAVWPTGSTQLPDGRIIISYAKYRVLLKTHEFTFMGAGLFQFTYRGLQRFAAGDQARRIANDIWTAWDGEVRSPIYAGGFVYFTQCEDLRCYSLRSTPAGMTRRSGYTWWTGAGWSTNAGARQQITVTTHHPGGNPSIVRLKSRLYAMADTEAGSVSAIGHFWVAPHPWGPWSAAASFRMPKCPAPGCYGLNLHAEASRGSWLRVSYATNGVGPFVRVDDVPVRIDPGGSWIRVK